MESKRDEKMFELELDFWGIDINPAWSDLEEKLAKIFSEPPSDVCR